MSDEQHRWAVVAITVLPEAMAAEIDATDLMDRMDNLCETMHAGRLETVRGPMCTRCRVHWRDVHADPAKPWPCNGDRPAELGGPLVTPDTRSTRSQRRAEQRRAVKRTARSQVDADQVKGAIEMGIMRARFRRREADAAKTGMVEGFDALGEALAGSDDLDQFWL